VYEKCTIDVQPVAAALPSRALPQAQWTPFSDSKGQFKLLLPGKPAETNDSPPTFTLGTSSGIYVITYTYTDGHEGADWAQTVNSERDVTMQGLNAKALGENAISIDGYRGKAARFECNLASGSVSGPASGQMRIYFNGHRFYMLIGLEPKTAKPEAIAKFLDSFELLPASKSH
jgi:hypothetical protein